MLNYIKVLLLGILSVTAPLAIAADTSACMACHTDDVFAQLSADDISAAVKDASIPPHKSFAGISETDLAAIAAALAGSQQPCEQNP